MRYKKIVLIGMMGSGKTAVAKKISEKINFALIELDEIFEKSENISIRNFFEKYGEAEFRKKENIILKNNIEKDNVVISTGGGVILEQKNRDLLFQDDILTIYLNTEPQIIYQRIKNDTTRPLLLVDNPLERIKDILLKREVYYNKAKLKIETNNKTIEEVVKEIELWIK